MTAFTAPVWPQFSGPSITVHAVIRNHRDELLLVNPTEGQGWSLPGGWLLGIDPAAGLQRIVVELTGIESDVGRLLAIDCVSGVIAGQPVVALHYAVHPRRVSLATEPRPLGKEGGAQTAYLPEDEALKRLPEGVRRRLLATIDAEGGAHTAQLHNGNPRLARAEDVYGTAPAPLVSAAALITDQVGRLLVMQRPYQGGLELPGGLAQARETPGDAARRGIREALGLDVTVGRLLAADHSTRSSHRRAVTAHVYATDALSEQQITTITHSGSTRTTAFFLPEQEALAALPALLATRTSVALSALKAGSFAHLEDGRAHTGSPIGMPATRRAELEHAGALRPEDFVAVRPKAMTAAAVLFTDDEDRVLTVKPTYLPNDWWNLPGGGCDSDTGENPGQAAEREVREELGLDRPLGPLLAVDWINRPPRPAGVVYVYDGGRLTTTDLAAIRLPEKELSDWRLVTATEAEELLSDRLSARVHACLAARAAGAGAIELNDGQPLRHRATVIVHTRNELLLLQDADSNAPNELEGPRLWTLPGCSVAPGESPAEAVKTTLLDTAHLRGDDKPSLVSRVWDRDSHALISVFAVPVKDCPDHLMDRGARPLRLVDPADLDGHPMPPCLRAVLDRWLTQHTPAGAQARPAEAV
ncbi:NUDIX hydrolase [Streptomyces bluensis]|uniref:NUDIX hydrolase n=1 Tax=Streptomyces bluensis TaxID=33897 RepID=UPI003324609D